MINEKAMQEFLSEQTSASLAADESQAEWFDRLQLYLEEIHSQVMIVEQEMDAEDRVKEFIKGND